MGYDLYLIRGETGSEVRDWVERVLAADDPTPLWYGSADDEAAREPLAAALLAHNPALERNEFDSRAIAEMQGWSEADARHEFRWVELVGPDEADDHVTVEIYGRGTQLSFPWGTVRTARHRIEVCAGYARVAQRVAGCLMFDPQLFDVVEPQQDLERVLASYLKGIGQVEDMIQSGEGIQRLEEQLRPESS